MSSKAHSEALAILRKGFDGGVLFELDSRKNAIRAILKLVEENVDSIVEACAKDLHRPKSETLGAEVWLVKREANVMLANMDSWLADEYVSRSFVSMLDTPYIQKQPLGVVIIFGSWNYPILLTLQPLIGAIAAGNTALVKPSEHAPASSEFLMKSIPKYLNSSVCNVICGDAQLSASLLDTYRFDHIFYTGGANGGRAVYAAAAKFLTPITLELGGKSPSYVDSHVNIMLAVRRILWSKIYNAGQTCVATDYVICHRDVVAEFCRSTLQVLKEFLGEDPHQSPDFARIVNKFHLQRLTKLLSATKGKIIYGGDSILDELYIAPTVVTDVKPDDSLMSEELFGPILPIMTVESSLQAVEFVRSRDKPLALYVFTSNQDVFSQFKQGTSSGSLSHNDCCSHMIGQFCAFYTLFTSVLTVWCLSPLFGRG
ncbi:hypothetical protein EG68_10659 [Paragonimus skrjabini miyazakii]|uniref:Aldehyde dehydrogenase n=1 Tax=Paragonimus skrjabini miyazakii TaxID=59628 RepID=A0A8S9YLP7_9TREM|nr:hypothetical protein EG68_10659 [Paragonimus skrjabini miyazakii]